MSMRKEWQDAKSLSEVMFKKSHPLPKDPHINPAKGYPLKFKDGLGPALDDYEKSKNPKDKLKYATKAKEAIGTYKTAITEAKKDLGSDAADLLTGTLKSIEKRIV